MVTRLLGDVSVANETLHILFHSVLATLTSRCLATAPLGVFSILQNFVLFFQSQNLSELVGLCSGNFPQNSQSFDTSAANPTTQDLLELCSGSFSTLINSGDETNETKDGSAVEDDSIIISQLLDEADLERFKKKFVSPVIAAAPPAQEVQATGLLDSDDETDILEVKSKKKQKKLVFSDEEEDETKEKHSSDEYEEEEEPIGAYNSDREALSDDVIDYDSEENEIGPDDVRSKMKINDFLEKEAELSESEWGSADEDERDLDEMEREKGDEEVFDENQVKNDLERIHM